MENVVGILDLAKGFTPDALPEGFAAYICTFFFFLNLVGALYSGSLNSPIITVNNNISIDCI